MLPWSSNEGQGGGTHNTDGLRRVPLPAVAALAQGGLLMRRMRLEREAEDGAHSMRQSHRGLADSRQGQILVSYQVRCLPLLAEACDPGSYLF